MSQLKANIRKVKRGIRSLLSGKIYDQRRKEFPHVPKELFDDYVIVSHSFLFDPGWYLAQYPDVTASGEDPLLHYLVHGFKEDRDPGSGFSTLRYLQSYPDVKDSNANPLIHYLRHGKEEGRTYENSTLEFKQPLPSTPSKPALKPKPFRSYKQNSKEYLLIKESGLFDEHWYLSENPGLTDQGIDPIEHFLNIGHREGKDPHPLFNTSWYLNRYAHVLDCNENPLIHYIQRGGIERLDPHPIFRTEWFYRSNADLASLAVNPLIHYCDLGYKEKRAVHPLFDEAFYLRQAGLNDNQTNGLFHYLTVGWKQGLNPNPFFDVAYYIDHALNGRKQEPLSHFVQENIAQKINPSLYFDTDYYVHTNLCPGSSAAVPLIHFLTTGLCELRRPSAFFRIFDLHRDGGLNSIRHTADLEKYIYKGSADPVYEYLETKARMDKKESIRLRSVMIKKGDLYELTESDVPAAVAQIGFSKVEQPRISVIIPYYKARKYVIEAMLSLSRKTDPDLLEVILVNDNSPDDIGDLARQMPNLIYLENKTNLHFVKSCNRGGEAAKGEYLFFLNCDAQITPNTLENLLKTMDEDPSIGVAGPKVLYPSGHLQEAGCRIFADGTSGMIGLNDDPALARYCYSKEVDYVSGCSLLIRKELFHKVGGFSNELAPAYCEDADLCMKVRAMGYKIWYQHDSVVYHHLSVSTDSAMKNLFISRNREIIFKKWFKQIQELNDVRIVSFYLPQFHPYKENEFWWGKGFTEWINTTKAVPNYEGHIQPKLPTEQGFYDLRLPENMDHQKMLADKYGVSGFCFYYYWFAGKKLMELPIDRILEENRPDIPFCLCWANENFTSSWDGGENEVMLGQKHSDEDDEAVIKDLLRYARHKNYIRIKGKPVILIYRITLFPDIKRTVAAWRRIARETGVGEIFLGFIESFQQAYLMDNPMEYGFDFSTQFPPHQNAAAIPPPGKVLNRNFSGQVHDYRESVLNYAAKPVPGFRRFPSVMPGWDNTPRQKNKSNIFAFSNPGSFQAWLEWNIKVTCEQNAPGERFIFVNAWNEWAEGAFLEPTGEHGHGFLEAIRHARQSWLK